jgi:hypothetical protein
MARPGLEFLSGRRPWAGRPARPAYQAIDGRPAIAGDWYCSLARGSTLAAETGAQTASGVIPGR